MHLPGVWQLGLHEELLGTLCWIEVALPGHPLNLLQLASLGSSLNVPAPSHAFLHLFVATATAAARQGKGICADQLSKHTYSNISNLQVFQPVLGTNAGYLLGVLT